MGREKRTGASRMSEWQPIESYIASLSNTTGHIIEKKVLITDGKDIDVAYLCNDYPLTKPTWVICSYSDGCYECNPDGIPDHTESLITPTHWMSLTKLPKVD